jgi:hypothetical protein
MHDWARHKIQGSYREGQDHWWAAVYKSFRDLKGLEDEPQRGRLILKEYSFKKIMHRDNVIISKKLSTTEVLISAICEVAASSQ